MIKFYEAPIDNSMKVYDGETKGKDWNDASYLDGLPKNFADKNTKEEIKKILQSKASAFAFPEKERNYFVAAVSDESNEAIMVVLKGLHQREIINGIELAHITVAWTATLWHLYVKVNGTGALSVHKVSEGGKAVSSEATGWTVVGKG